jgi:hypothetical protein
MVRMVEPEVARASNAFWASAASLMRKALIDVNAHLSRSHHLEQLVRGSVEQNLGAARLPNLDRMRHTDFHKNV